MRCSSTMPSQPVQLASSAPVQSLASEAHSRFTLPPLSQSAARSSTALRNAGGSFALKRTPPMLVRAPGRGGGAGRGRAGFPAPPCFATAASSCSNASLNSFTPSCSSWSVRGLEREAGLLELGELLLRAGDIGGQRRLDDAVVLERLERLHRHRVHGLGADQLFDVEHVAVLRVLRAGRAPQEPLRHHALLRERAWKRTLFFMAR